METPPSAVQEGTLRSGLGTCPSPRRLIHCELHKPRKVADKAMFNKDHFIQDCMNAVAEGQGAIRGVVTEAVSDSVGVMSELGEPEHAGITPIYRSHDLTI